jgi:transposase
VSSELDRLRAENEALRQAVLDRDGELAALKAALAALEVEVERLRRETGRHSGNSGKPPSADTISQRQAQNEKRQSRAERRRAARQKAKKLAEQPKRKPGKQPGDPGATLRQVDDPDTVISHAPGCCAGCGGDLGDAEVVDVEPRQVFDLPARTLEVTEHRAETRRCGCGRTTKAAFPGAARATVCYGPLVRAVGVYLVAGQHIPVARAAELLAQVCGAPVSTGWLASLASEAGVGLAGFTDWLKATLSAEDVLHADETSARVSGAAFWFHVACTDLLTFLDCHPKRGAKALEDMAILPLFRGVLVSDGWKPYWTLDGFDHALCLSHLLRDLAAVAEFGRHQLWADAMAELLVEAKNTLADALAAGKTGLPARQLKAFRARYDAIIADGKALVPAHHQPGSANREAHNLLARLTNQRDEVTRYWSNPDVPATNNQAERDLRMIKLQRKISGCFRTLQGAKDYCAIRSYLQTAVKHGQQRLDVLVSLFNGQPWIPSGGSP